MSMSSSCANNSTIAVHLQTLTRLSSIAKYSYLIGLISTSLLLVLLVNAIYRNTIHRRRNLFVLSRTLSDCLRCVCICLDWLSPQEMSYSIGHNFNHLLVSVQIWTLILNYLAHSSIMLLVVRAPMFYHVHVRLWHLCTLYALFWACSISIGICTYVWDLPNLLPSLSTECPFESCQWPSMLTHVIAVEFTYFYILLVCALVLITIVRANRQVLTSDDLHNWQRLRKMVFVSVSFALFNAPLMIFLIILLFDADEYQTGIRKLLACCHTDCSIDAFDCLVAATHRYRNNATAVNVIFVVRVLFDVLITVLNEKNIVLCHSKTEQMHQRSLSMIQYNDQTQESRIQSINGFRRTASEGAAMNQMTVVKDVPTMSDL